MTTSADVLTRAGGSPLIILTPVPSTRRLRLALRGCYWFIQTGQGETCNARSVKSSICLNLKWVSTPQPAAKARRRGDHVSGRLKKRPAGGGCSKRKTDDLMTPKPAYRARLAASSSFTSKLLRNAKRDRPRLSRKSAASLSRISTTFSRSLDSSLRSWVHGASLERRVFRNLTHPQMLGLNRAAASTQPSGGGGHK
jgi:hypothetical protein